MYRYVVSLLPILFLSGCFWNKAVLPQITLEANNLNYNYEVGQQFQVVLPSNQTTGYKWEVEDITMGALIEVKSEYRLVDDEQGMVGVGSEEIWTFMVEEVKRSHVVMQYRKPWDKTDVDNYFLITINGNPGDDGLLTYVGSIELSIADAQFDDCFVADDGSRFGLEPYEQGKVADPGVATRLKEFGQNQTRIEIRGEFIDPAIDCNGKQLIVHEIQAIS